MGTTLTGTTPQDTYDSLIKVTDNGPISGTAKFLSDGLGNDSALALSTTAVGVGTASPTNKLSIFSSGSSAVTIADIVGGASGAAVLQLSAGKVLSTSSFDLIQNAAGAFINQRDNNPLGIFVNGAERITITSAGNVGIGTNAPATKLEVSSSDLNNIFVTNPTTSGTTTGSGIGLKAYNGTSVAQYGSIVLTSNTWSFGTYSPQQLSIGSDGTGGIALRSTLSAPITFHTGGTFSGEAVERVRITNNGLTFNGDTAAANALDDYEEGTFTATLAPSTSGTITLSVNTCTYTKIGRQVTVKGFLTISSVSLPVGASFDINGLPFTIINSTAGRGTFSFVVLDASAGYTAFTGPTQHTANSTTIIAFFDTSTLAASDEIMFTATYFV